jgi:hypothetical protein
MLIIGYSRNAAAGAAGGVGASISALPAQGNTTSGGGTSTGYNWVQDVSTVPDGARCLLVAWAPDSAAAPRSIVSITADVGNTPAAVGQHSISNGTYVGTVGIYEWTKESGTSVTFNVKFQDNMLGGGFQLFYMENVHASAVTGTQSGSSLASTTCALSSALATAANGVALFAAIGVRNSSSNDGTWSVTPDHETDQSVEAFLRLHAAACKTDGSPLDPTLTFAQANVLTVMAAVSIPPA